jgi:hypothetical protein
MPAMPKFDVGRSSRIRRRTSMTVVSAQKIVFDLAQTVAKRNADMMREMFQRAGTMRRVADAGEQPQSYADEAKSAMAKVMADVKETMDLGIKAQGEVVDLFVKRATQNFEEVKALAA